MLPFKSILNQCKKKKETSSDYSHTFHRHTVRTDGRGYTRYPLHQVSVMAAPRLTSHSARVLLYSSLGTHWLSYWPIVEERGAGPLHPGYTNPWLKPWTTGLKYTYPISSPMPHRGLKRSSVSAGLRFHTKSRSFSFGLLWILYEKFFLFFFFKSLFQALLERGETRRDGWRDE